MFSELSSKYLIYRYIMYPENYCKILLTKTKSVRMFFFKARKKVGESKWNECIDAG